MAVASEDPRSFLFDCFVRVSFEPVENEAAAGGKSEWEPRVVDRVPSEIDEDLVSVFPLIPQFCFSDLEEPEPINGGGNPIVDVEPHFFMFVLTDAQAEHIYVSCVVRYTVVTPSWGTQPFKVPVALCLLGRNPYFELGYKVLVALCHFTSSPGPEDQPRASSHANRFSMALASVSPTAMLLSSRASTAAVPPPPGPGAEREEDVMAPLLIKQFLKDMVLRTRSPPVGERLAIDVFGRRLDWQRIDHCPGMSHVDDDMLLVLIARLPVAAIVEVIEALLMEQKVVLHSHYRNELVPCCEALFSLMTPFWWQHTYVPCLPALLIEYLEAPFPYLMGIRTGGILEAPVEQREVLDDVVLVDLNRGIVTPPVNPSEGGLPGIPEPLRSKLLADVEHIVEQNAPREAPKWIDHFANRSRSHRSHRSRSIRIDHSANREPKTVFSMPTWRDLHASRGIVQGCLKSGGPNRSYAIWIDQIRAAFLRTWVSKEDSGMFLSYKNFLRLDAASPAPLALRAGGAQMNRFEKIFDKDGFLKASLEAHRPFLQAFFKTQLFVTLIQDAFEHFQGTKVGNSQDLQLLDVCTATTSNDGIDNLLCRKPIKTWQTHDAGLSSDALPLEGIRFTCFPSLPKSGSLHVSRGGASLTVKAESSTSNDSEPSSPTERPQPLLRRMASKRSMNSFSIKLSRTRNSRAHSSHDLMSDSIQISGNADRLSRLLQPDLEGLENLDRAVSAAAALENRGAAEESSSAGAGTRRRPYKKNVCSL